MRSLPCPVDTSSEYSKLSRKKFWSASAFS